MNLLARGDALSADNLEERVERADILTFPWFATPLLAEEQNLRVTSCASSGCCVEEIAMYLI
jgi:hypothetical protein